MHKLTVDQALALVEQERLDELAALEPGDEFYECAAYVLASEIRRIRAARPEERLRVPIEEVAHMVKRLREYIPVEGQEGLRVRDMQRREAALMIEDLVGPSPMNSGGVNG